MLKDIIIKTDKKNTYRKCKETVEGTCSQIRIIDRQKYTELKNEDQYGDKK